MKSKILLIALLLSFLGLHSAEIEVEAYVDDTTISIDDALNYTISIKGKDANKIGTPELPDFDGFSSAGVSSSYKSSSVFNNGKFESTIEKQFTYTLYPEKTGKITIPSITIKYRNKSYKTQAIRIEVSGNRNSTSNSGSNPQANTQNTSQNIFIDVQVSNTTPYQNEPVTVEFTLYSKYSISSLAYDAEPSYTGFWKEDIFSPSNINMRRTSYKGEAYYAMKLKKIALFPTKSGKITLEPLAMKVGYLTNSHSIYSFGKSRTKTFRSNKVDFNVKPLPAGAPDSFKGTVGNFSINSSISDTNLKVGDSFTWSVTIAGKGNFNSLNLPELNDINHFRILEPEVETSISNDKISGQKTIRYLGIPQEAGNFVFPTFEFSYFDYTQEKYRTLKTQEYNMNIEESDTVFLPGSAAQTEIKLEGSDIGYIITDLPEDAVIFFDSAFYWLAVIIIILILPVSLTLIKRQDILAGDFDYQRQKKAARILKKYLKLASQYRSEGNKDFYSATQSGLANYVTDKLKIPRGSQIEDIIKTANKSQIPADTVNSIKELFSRCNEARFMPGGFSQDNINTDYEMLKTIIADLSRLKIKRTQK